MKGLFSFLCCILFFYTSVTAQSNLIKGRVVDTTSTSILSGASVSILRAKDSTLVKFTRALDIGAFEMSNVPEGAYILLIAYPKYADFVDRFVVEHSRKNIDFGRISMAAKAKILSEVIIKGNKVAIRIKGDTTEFDPAAYHIAPNSKIEDLLKQFPGIQVDKDGKITAQGQPVNKVLVDGEEFFGDDPTLVTKNLRGNMVDKVQLYDKKSDQSTFTGIDDGERNKTLNIKLKEDSKNGYFGKLSAGISTDDYYRAQAMINKFTGKKKVAAYANAGNNGQVGLGWRDADKIGVSNNNEFRNDDMVATFSKDGLDGYTGQYDGQGLPVAQSGGLHFDNKWNADKEYINTNYKIGRIKVIGNRNTLSQNALPTGFNSNASDENFDNELFRQKLDVTYDIKLDTTLSLKVYLDATLKNSKTLSNYQASSTREDNSLLNSSTRNLSNDGREQLYNFNALLAKKFRKTGRTLSLSLNQSNNKNKSTGYLYAENDFYTPEGNPASESIVNQYKVNDISNSTFRSNLAFTEALTKSLTLMLNYGLGFNRGQSYRASFNPSSNGTYTTRDQEFSNDYELDQMTNLGGATFNFKKGKYSVTADTKISTVDFSQKDLINDKSYRRNFINYRPQANFRYSFSQQSTLNFWYNGNTNQPTLEQIQPIKVNTDPLNITLGNPDLRPSFYNNLNVHYNFNSVLKGQYFYINGAYGFTSRPIATNVITDTEGKNTYQAVNIREKTPINFSLYTSYSRRVRLADLRASLELRMNGTSSYNYTNNNLNNTKNYNYNGSLRVDKYTEKYSFSLSFGPTYNSIDASIQKSVNSNSWGSSGMFESYVRLPFQMVASTDGTYEYQGKTAAFDESLKRLIWNVAVSKTFLKSQSLKTIVSVDDLLNHKVGFSRFASENRIIQSSYTTIRRYFTLTVSWDFSKMGRLASK